MGFQEAFSWDRGLIQPGTSYVHMHWHLLAMSAGSTPHKIQAKQYATHLAQGLCIGAHVRQDYKDVFLTLVGQELCRGQGQARSDNAFNSAEKQSCQPGELVMIAAFHKLPLHINQISSSQSETSLATRPPPLHLYLLSKNTLADARKGFPRQVLTAQHGILGKGTRGQVSLTHVGSLAKFRKRHTFSMEPFSSKSDLKKRAVSMFTCQAQNREKGTVMPEGNGHLWA